MTIIIIVFVTQSGNFSGYSNFAKEDFHIHDEKDHCIGRGSFGEVYKYEHRDMKTVAIKFFPVTGSCDTMDDRLKAWVKSGCMVCDNLTKF